jgi:hypothetical protein
MEVCSKHSIKVTGCSKWNGGDTSEICDLCLSEVESNRKIPPLENTTVKTPYNTVKTRPSIVKTVPILEGGNKWERKENN